MIFRPAVFDSNALALDKTCLLQSLSKPSQVVRGDIGRLGVEQPDHGPPRLLAARSERPRYRRAANQPNDPAPVQVAHGVAPPTCRSGRADPYGTVSLPQFGASHRRVGRSLGRA